MIERPKQRYPLDWPFREEAFEKAYGAPDPGKPIVLSGEVRYSQDLDRMALEEFGTHVSVGPRRYEMSFDLVAVCSACNFRFRVRHEQNSDSRDVMIRMECPVISCRTGHWIRGSILSEQEIAALPRPGPFERMPPIVRFTSQPATE